MSDLSPLRRLAPITASLAVLLLVPSVGAAAQAPRRDGSMPVSASLQRQLTNIPARILDSVGQGGVDKPHGPLRIEPGNGMPLAPGGKPELFSYNFEWCPHCMATSWSLVVALSRFGRFGTLESINSGTYFGMHFGVNPAYPNTLGFSFLGVPYTSRYVKFAGVEGQGTDASVLVPPNPAQAAALGAYDKTGQVPFADFANKVILVGEGYSPGVLAGLSYQHIAASLRKPTSAVGRAIDGLANVFTAAICKTTRGRPAKVCKSKSARAGARRLAAG